MLLFQRKVDFLGHTLSTAGIEVQAAKIEAWPRPRDVHKVLQFMRTCSYYRQFILGFADIAPPLYSVQRKGDMFLD